MRPCYVISADGRALRLDSGQVAVLAELLKRSTLLQPPPINWSALGVLEEVLAFIERGEVPHLSEAAARAQAAQLVALGRALSLGAVRARQRAERSNEQPGTSAWFDEAERRLGLGGKESK